MKSFREYLAESKMSLPFKIKMAVAAILLAAGIATSPAIADNIAKRAVKNNSVLVREVKSPEFEDAVTNTIMSLPETKQAGVSENIVKQATKKYVPKFIDIPQTFRQAGYSVTGYAEKGISFAKNNVMKNIKPWSEGTNQSNLHKEWIKYGKKYTNGIASINMDGFKRYLIAVTDTYGKVGDRIDFKLANGDVIKCIIADIKDRKDGNWNKWGHVYDTNSGNKQTNIIEFEVNPAVYNLKKENPTTSGWDLPWKDKVNGKRNNIVSYSNIDRDGYELIDEMVMSGDVGGDLVPVRMLTKEVNTKKLCDFKEKKKKKKSKKWLILKKVL